MVQQALEEQEEMFREQHKSDTDAQLLQYLRAGALRLHHTPWPGEILGGSFIQERFGSWNRAQREILRCASQKTYELYSNVQRKLNTV